jgi:branched-chain amino acid transport system permease protein
MTIYFDSGFLIVLKAMVGAVIGGMLSYGAAVVGSLGVGVAEAFASYASSGFADTIVFTLLLPILLLRVLRHEERDVDRL